MTSAIVGSIEHLLDLRATPLPTDWRPWHYDENDADDNDEMDAYVDHLDAEFVAVDDLPHYCQGHDYDQHPVPPIASTRAERISDNYSPTPAGAHAWSDQYTCGCCAERIATDAVPVAEPFDRATAPVWSTASDLDIILTAETITAEYLQHLLLAETDPPESPHDLVDTLTSAPAGPPAARCLTVAR